MQDPFIHIAVYLSSTLAASPLRSSKSSLADATRRRLYTLGGAVTNVFNRVNALAAFQTFFARPATVYTCSSCAAQRAIWRE
jgi:hypothetical protein